MKEKNEEKRGEKPKVKREKKEGDIKDDTSYINEELIRWMTEGTSPNSTPRSDCG